MFYIIILLAILLTAFLIRSGYTYRHLSDEIRRLYNQSKNVSKITYSHTQLLHLPRPVQKYFRHVLKEGQPYVSYVNLTHTGVFKTDQNKDWVKIKGEEYFTTEKPGFLWQGNTNLFTATDKYINGKGNLKVSVLSTFTIVDGKGANYDHSELLRWLGESVWFPTNLLPSKYLKWLPIDEDSATLEFDYRGISVSYIVRFNEKGEIAELETKRYKDADDLETWIGRLSAYQLLNDMWIPTAIEALWKLKDGEFPYAKFNLVEIDNQKINI